MHNYLAEENKYSKNKMKLLKYQQTYYKIIITSKKNFMVFMRTLKKKKKIKL